MDIFVVGVEEIPVAKDEINDRILSSSIAVVCIY
jgi:hypothetical protein